MAFLSCRLARWCSRARVQCNSLQVGQGGCHRARWEVLEWCKLAGICSREHSLRDAVAETCSARGARGAGDDMHSNSLHGRGARLGEWKGVQSKEGAGEVEKPREALLWDAEVARSARVAIFGRG